MDLRADTAGRPERRSFSRRLLLAGILLVPVYFSHSWAGEILALTGASIIDGNGGPPLEDGVIIVRGQKISAIGPSPAIPATARLIDLAGKTLLPGLIDAHIHIGGSGGGSVDPREFTTSCC